jgi:hypothetical protein
MGLLVFALAFVLIWVLLAGLVGEFAEKRGHSSALWYVFSLVCSPLIGFAVVAGLPSAADLAPVGYKPCPYCMKTVMIERKICPYCSADLSGQSKVEKRAA